MKWQGEGVEGGEPLKLRGQGVNVGEGWGGVAAITCPYAHSCHQTKEDSQIRYPTSRNRCTPVANFRTSFVTMEMCIELTMTHSFLTFKQYTCIC